MSYPNSPAGNLVTHDRPRHDERCPCGLTPAGVWIEHMPDGQRVRTPYCGASPREPEIGQ
ncbi:hypothetical protein [Amycolatopsis sp. H20-H5]|uniref:hypothetical protein n=1 Tax=Amycolatopsis sp. H20-H5 TaxID=3046309 RepID=UPI002DBD1B6E|nr:hypothetical protein [Amycolatopsis sp. H20-H5]MEC3975071.1 hypothetical protein [Amycolatopsis sp. H20-H5]